MPRPADAAGPPMERNDILSAEGRVAAMARAAGKQLNLRARLPPTRAHSPKEAAADGRSFSHSSSRSAADDRLNAFDTDQRNGTFLPNLTR
jgi:hypothetical protein